MAAVVMAADRTLTMTSRAARSRARGAGRATGTGFRCRLAKFASCNQPFAKQSRPTRNYTVFDSAAMFSQEYHQDLLTKNDGAETIYLISHDTL